MGNPVGVHAGRGAVLVDEPTEHVVASNVAERRENRDHLGDRCRPVERDTRPQPCSTLPGLLSRENCHKVTSSADQEDLT